MPIPIYMGGDYGPLSEEAINSLIGMLIFLTIIWLINTPILIYKYYKKPLRYLEGKKSIRNLIDYLTDYEVSMGSQLLNMGMIIIYAMIILFFVGTQIGKLL